MDRAVIPSDCRARAALKKPFADGNHLSSFRRTRPEQVGQVRHDDVGARQPEFFGLTDPVDANNVPEGAGAPRSGARESVFALCEFVGRWHDVRCRRRRADLQRVERVLADRPYMRRLRRREARRGSDQSASVHFTASWELCPYEPWGQRLGAAAGAFTLQSGRLVAGPHSGVQRWPHAAPGAELCQAGTGNAGPHR